MRMLMNPRSMGTLRLQSLSMRQRHKSTVAVGATESISDQPTLTKVPSLPIAGSLYQPYSKIPIKFEQNSVFEFWPAMREKFGDFYELGIPGLGVGANGICYVIQCPYEMSAVLRQEGEYPTGAAEFAWAFKNFYLSRGMAVGGLVHNGPQWKRMRRFIQQDLLSKQSAQRYVPAILEAAVSASKGAPSFAQANNLNEYLNLASFDLFSNVMLGSLPHVSSADGDADDIDRKFCHHVASSLRLNGKMTQSVWDAVLVQKLGIKTQLYKEFEGHWSAAQEMAMAKFEELYQLGDKKSKQQENSYAAQAFVRVESEENAQAGPDLHVTLDEAKTVVGGLLSAGVDTTGGMLSWKMLHLASSPEAQDKLWHELQPTLLDGKLTEESLQLPYLNAILRESHRIANSNVTVPIKSLAKDFAVHGQILPKGSIMILDTYSCGMDQDNFEDDVREFKPERFLKEAVQKRKNTAAAKVDHSFFKGPFSQGARKCPGSRVATLEAHALVAQWVLDYKMELPPEANDIYNIPYGLETVTTAYLPQIQFTPRTV